MALSNIEVGMKIYHLSLHLRFAIVDKSGLKPWPSDARAGVHASRSIGTKPESYLQIWGVHPRSEGMTQPKKAGPGVSVSIGLSKWLLFRGWGTLE